MNPRSPSPEASPLAMAQPKTELHVHLEGTMMAQTFLTLARKNRHPDFMDMSEAEALAMYEYRAGPEGFMQFLDLFGYCSQVIQNPDDIVFVAERYGEYAMGQNIHYAELTFTPSTINNQEHGIPYAQQLVALRRSIQSVRQKTTAAGNPVELRFILDHSRGYTLEDCIATAKMCMDGAKDGTVVAMGLAGGEVGHPVSEWAGPIYGMIGDKLPLVPHTAEAVGPEAILDARDSWPGTFTRFGHGIQAANGEAGSNEALAYLARKGIVLELCPSSNLATGVVSSQEQLVRYVRTLQEAKVPYIIGGTDDPAQLPNARDGKPNTLNREYDLLLELGLETPGSLATRSLLAVRASFLPPPQKQLMIARLNNTFAQQGYNVPALHAALPHSHRP